MLMEKARAQRDMFDLISILENLKDILLEYEDVNDGKKDTFKKIISLLNDINKFENRIVYSKYALNYYPEIINKILEINYFISNAKATGELMSKHSVKTLMISLLKVIDAIDEVREMFYFGTKKYEIQRTR